MGKRTLTDSQASEYDRKKQDQPHDHLLRIGEDAEETQKVADQSDDDDADHGLHDPAVSAGEARSANYHRRDGIQLPSFSDPGLAQIQSTSMSGIS